MWWPAAAEANENPRSPAPEPRVSDKVDSVKEKVDCVKEVVMDNVKEVVVLVGDDRCQLEVDSIFDTVLSTDNA